MAFQIGFILVTYNQPAQTTLLCERLSQHFGDPPIAIHHDYSQSDLPQGNLPSNVHVVSKWRRTRWGDLSVVEAVIAATRLLYEKASPDWCVSLSTTDYPVKAPESICTELADSDADAFLDHRVLHAEAPPAGHVRQQAMGFADPAWVPLAYDRYVAVPLVPRLLARAIRLPIQHMRYLRTPWAKRMFTPFNEQFRPYGGDSWFSFNRRAAQAFTQDSRELSVLRKHFAHRGIPEESFYHTLLCNQPDLRFRNENLRYVDWSAGGNNPKVLGRADLPAIFASGAHFARKFPFDPALYDEIDRAITGAVALQ